MAKKNDYTAEKIQVLEGLEPVRKRPGMYIGSTDERGYHESIREIVDNSVDESYAGKAKDIWVRVEKDNKVIVLRDGKAYMQEYSAGKPKKPVHEITQAELNSYLPDNWQVKINKSETGTITRFLLDKVVFGDVVPQKSKIQKLLKDRAYLVAGLSFHYTDARDGSETNYYFEGGIKSQVKHGNRDKVALSDVIFVTKEEGVMNVEVAIQYTDTYNENVRGYVNGINTTDGGTHVTGFRMALTRSVVDYAKKSGAIKENGNGKGNGTLTGDDLKEGLSAIVYVKMPSESLQFESQTKAKLNNPEVQ